MNRSCLQILFQESLRCITHVLMGVLQGVQMGLLFSESSCLRYFSPNTIGFLPKKIQHRLGLNRIRLCMTGFMSGLLSGSLPCTQFSTLSFSRRDLVQGGFVECLPSHSTASNNSLSISSQSFPHPNRRTTNFLRLVPTQN